VIPSPSFVVDVFFGVVSIVSIVSIVWVVSKMESFAICVYLIYPLGMICKKISGSF
jgi:hypothetical protein